MLAGRLLVRGLVLDQAKGQASCGIDASSDHKTRMVSIADSAVGENTAADNGHNGIRLEVSSANVDVVPQWNITAINTILAARQDIILGSVILDMVHAAIYDVGNSRAGSLRMPCRSP